MSPCCGIVRSDKPNRTVACVAAVCRWVRAALKYLTDWLWVWRFDGIDSASGGKIRVYVHFCVNAATLLALVAVHVLTHICYYSWERRVFCLSLVVATNQWHIESVFEWKFVERTTICYIRLTVLQSVDVVIDIVWRHRAIYRLQMTFLLLFLSLLNTSYL